MSAAQGDNEPPGALAAPGVRVVLAGTGSHVAGSVLPPVAAVGPTLAEVGRVLVERCGLGPAGLRTVADPADPLVLGDALAGAADQATDVLLFYYVGHGLVSPGGELHLATLATDDLSRGLAYKALPFSAVRDTLNGCPARAIVIVLDCCFAGRARGPLGAQSDDGFAAAQVGGSYLLAASAHDEQALAPAGEPYTAFSGALIGLLREGDPRGPRSLTLGHAYRYLSQTLPARGLPRPRRHAGGLADDLVLAPNAAYRPAAARLPRLMPAGGPEGEEDAAEQRSPYPGLAAFGPQDARFFFGREQLTAELTGRLADAATHRPGPLVVIGASGSGKSSLLRAGVVAAMERGAVPVPGSLTWPGIILTPGAAPLQRTAAALSAAAAIPADEISAGLREEPGRLASVLRAILARRSGEHGEGHGRLVLFVDQFEELFALCPDETERGAFLDALIAACGAAPADDGSEQSPDPAAVVVLALRADFYGRCMAYPALVSALRDGQVLVGPMTDGELRDAIEKPAAAAGLALQPGLADLLLRDLRGGGGPGQDSGGTLPLLSYALLSTWQRREGRELTMAGYQEAGGIWGAVAQEAERIYAQLAPAGQAAARAILLAMVRIGEGTADTRRSADLDELMRRRFSDDTGAFARARDELASARLITLRAGSADITHEALLRAWPRLAAWIEEDRSSLLVRQRLADAAATWQRADRDPAALYRGTLLATARQWADGHEAGLAPLDQEFLDASTELDRTEQQAARRRTRHWRQASGVLTVLVIAALIATFLAIRAQHAAHTNALTARSRELAAQSANFAAQALADQATNPQQAALRALAGWQSAHTAAARGSLLSVQLDSYNGPLIGAGLTWGAAVSPDGRLIATAGYTDRTFHLWDTRTRRQIASFHVNATQTAKVPALADAVAFSPDGRVLAGGVVSTRAVWLWNVASRRLIRILTGKGASALAFSPDGHVLAVAEGDGTVHLFNPASGTQIAVLPSDATILSLAFSPDGRLLAAGGRAGTATDPHAFGTTQVWDVATRALVATLPPRSDNVTSVAFSPDSRLLASGGIDGQITLWDADTRSMIASLSRADTGTATPVAFSPDGLDVIAGNSAQTISVWSVATRALVAVQSMHAGRFILTLAFSKNGHTLVVGGTDGAYLVNFHTATLSSPEALTGVAFSPGGRLIATSGTDGAIRLWDRATRWPARVLATTHGGSAYSVAFSPDSRLLASGSVDGSVRLWDPVDGKQLAALRTMGTWARRVVFSPDGTRLAALSLSPSPTEPGGIQLWDARTHDLVATKDDSGAFAGPAFSPDGSLLAYGRDAGPDNAGIETSAVLLLNSHTLRTVATLKAADGVIYGVAFSPDGRTVAASFEDGTIRLWDTRSGRPVGAGTGNSGHAFDIAFSPDGRTLAVGGSDSLVRLIDVRTGTPIATLEGHNEQVSDVAFSADGQTLASASGDGSVLLWNLDPGRAVQRLCQALRGPSLASQWAALHAGIGPPPC